MAGEDDDFSAALSELESEQFKDGEVAQLRDEKTGEFVKKEGGDDDDGEDAVDKDKATDNEGDGGTKAGDDDEDDDDDDDDDEDGTKAGDDEDDDDDQPDEGKRKNGNGRVEKRISQLTRKNGDLERQLAELRAKMDAPKNADGSVKTPAQLAKEAFEADENAPKKPDASKFALGEFDEAYRDAYDDYLAERRRYLEEKEAEFKASTEKPSAAAVPEDAQEVKDKLDAHVAAGRKAFKDFDKVVVEGAKNGDWECSDFGARFIADSEVGADVAYRLASDPALAKEIAGLSQTQQARRLGTLENEILTDKADKKAKAKRGSSAPEPIGSAKGGGGAGAPGFDSEDFEAVEKRWSASKKKAG